MFLEISNKEPEKVAFIDDSDCSVTYGQLISFSQIATDYVSSRSLIFILAENTVGAVIGTVVSMMNKVVPLLINSSIEQDDLEGLIHRYEPTYIWLPKTKVNNTDYQIVIEAFDYVLIKTTYEKCELFEDLALLLPTSGSTGAAKLVRHSYDNIEFSAANVAKALELESNDRPLLILPMQYTMGLSVITSHLFVGATIILTQKSLLDRGIWNIFRDREITSITGVPYSYEILSKIKFFDMDLPALKVISQGGGKMTEDLFKRCVEYADKTGRKFYATYGQTEGTARMAYLPAALAKKKICSIGNAIPNGVFELIDAEGKMIIDANVQGELVYKGGNVTLGYAQSKEDLLKGDDNKSILYTGDIAIRDDDNCLFIVGRKSRFLKLYGIRVSLDECEAVIKSNFNIPCACTGNDKQMNIYVEDATFQVPVQQLLVEKTKLLRQVFNVIVVDNILKNESGKTLYSKLDKN